MTKPDFDLKITVAEGSVSPLIDRSHPASADNAEGYENGSVIKLENGEYHMLITELFYVDDAMKQGSWSPARIGHWVSKDGEDWQRLSTVVQGSAVLGEPHENTWSPSFFWNGEDNRWNVFWRGASAVFRYESQTPDRGGIDGPYTEAKMIWPPLLGEPNWDFGGFASFGNPFPTVRGDYGVFYCSGGEENGHNNWTCGLAFADRIDGPWRRNPETAEPTFLYCENPFVYVYDGVYYCVYDDLSCQKSIGVGYSADGVHWARKLVDLTDAVLWANSDWYVNSLRTPMSFIREADGTYTVFFTAAEQRDGYFSVGRLRLAAERVKKRSERGKVSLAALASAVPLSGSWSFEHGELSQDDMTAQSAMLAAGEGNSVTVEAVLRCVDAKPPEAAACQYFARENTLYTTQGGVFFGLGEERSAAYFVQLNAEGQLLLSRGSRLLAAVRLTSPPYIFTALKVELAGGTLTVKVNGKLCLRTELAGYAGGAFGLTANRSHWHFEALSVKHA